VQIDHLITIEAAVLARRPQSAIRQAQESFPTDCRLTLGATLLKLQAR
jgi:hypothetical protein